MSDIQTKRTIVEMGACAGASSINVFLGIITCIAIAAVDFIKHKKLIYLVRLSVLLLYPITIYILRTYNEIFGIEINAIDGFGLAFGVFSIHALANGSHKFSGNNAC